MHYLSSPDLDLNLLPVEETTSDVDVLAELLGNNAECLDDIDGCCFQIDQD